LPAPLNKALALMKSVAHRTLGFAGTAFIVLLLADLAVWGGYQGMHPREDLQSQLLMRAALHLSVLVVSAIGATFAFFLLRQRLPSTKVASSFGAIFAAISFFALVAAFTAFGVVGAGAWLLVGSVITAVVSSLIAGQHVG
jgi:hypothetical protein